MSFPIRDLAPADFPRRLKEIPQRPTTLNYRGTLPPSGMTLISVVGSRKYSSYGAQVVDELITGLRGLPVGIVSGLAIGIDSLGHETALKNNLYTLAIPGGGLDDAALYPARHKRLAARILEAGGGLLSEFAPDFRATKWSFPQRNRLVAGISHGTLLIEAGEQSGTLITARMATDYNRELMVVPGSIFSAVSRGTHQFLKLGATPVTSSEDIIDALGISRPDAPAVQTSFTLSPDEQHMYELLTEPTHRDELIRNSKLETRIATQTLMMMELRGTIASHDNIYRRNEACVVEHS